MVLLLTQVIKDKSLELVIYAPTSDDARAYRISFSVFCTCVHGYVHMNVCPSVRMCVRTYVILLDSG